MGELPLAGVSGRGLRLLGEGETACPVRSQVRVSADLLRNHLHQQVLDRLHETYSFGLHPMLVEREFEAIWKVAQAQGATESLTPEFRAIAERRVRLGAIVAEMARRHQIRSQPIEDNVIDYFLAQARVTERRVGVEELRDLAER